MIGEAILLGVGALGIYTLACIVWPYSACSRCSGSGKRSSPSGRAFRDCLRCSGTGKRVRLGRRLFGR
jgi:DnaJ-class molecular chaperone